MDETDGTCGMHVCSSHNQMQNCSYEMWMEESTSRT